MQNLSLPHGSRFLNNHQSLEHITLYLWEQSFHQIKVITMMKDYDQSVAINHNPNWPNIPDHPYRILIIDGSE